jgi:hypothetical protein
LLADVDADPPKERDHDRDDVTMTTTAVAEKTSYDLCLAAWGMWLVEWRRADESDADISTRQQDVFFQLVQALVSASARRDDSSSSSSPSSHGRADHLREKIKNNKFPSSVN